MELKDIKAIIDLMKKNSITEFELEEKESKLRLKRGIAAGAAAIQNDEPTQIVSTPYLAPTAALPVAAPAMTAPANTGEIEIKSPMIGTFYRSPSPESAPYVDIGSEVDAETVVCIIEAMKVMNEIKAEVKGVVTQVLVESGKPVEFGQALFKIRPA